LTWGKIEFVKHYGVTVVVQSAVSFRRILMPKLS